MNSSLNKQRTECFHTTELEQIILKEEIDYDYIDERGFSLLHIACLTGMIDLCKLLLENGVCLNGIDFYGRTPLMMACGAGYFSLSEFLVNSGADTNISDTFGFNALLMAISAGDVNLVKFLMDKTELNCKNEYLGTLSALTLASSIGNRDIVEIVSKKSRNIDSQLEFSGLTPLMLAVCGGHSSTIQLLLQEKPDLNIKSCCSFTAPEYAYVLQEPQISSLFNICNLSEALTASELKIGSCPRKEVLKAPLTPNLCLSPIRKTRSPKKCITWIKNSIKLRSRSLDSRKKPKYIEDNYENIVEYILITASLSHYWPIFKEQQINFRTFLTMNEEDLISIGIRKQNIRNKMLSLIHHYNKIFIL